ncbi:MAG: polysaccharide deacetylase family protein [Rhodocyclaceae bacterium]|nr:polysaccharide deacetylase family protein [Rhodocyclaceae bacterium]
MAAISGVCRNPKAGLRILMYHAVGGEAYGDFFGNYTITPEHFAQHMDALRGFEGANVVPLGLESCGGGAQANIAISFDDGYLDNLRFAAPILIERGMPFTVFVSSQFVQEQHAGFLNPEDLRELAELPGVMIGAHGRTHVPLVGCDDLTLAHELVDSKMYLEDITGRPVSTMSYPYGSVDRRVLDAVSTAGYQLAACSHIGINQAGRDPLLLARTTIFGQDSVSFFRRKLAGCWDWYGCLQRDSLHREN